MNEINIRENVIQQLQYDAKIDSSNIEVKVAKDAVILNGKVPNYSQKAIAEEDAFSLKEVYKVENNLEVEPPLTPELPLDSELKARIESALDWRNDIDASNISVEVNEHWVTLAGYVDAYWKKILAENETFNTRGVAGVSNKIAVKPAKELSDGQINENISKALRLNVNTIASEIDIKVKKGNVILSGKVPSKAKKDSAIDVAASAEGIKDIKDEIKILS